MAGLTPKLLYIGNGDESNVYTVANTVGAYTIIKNLNFCNTSNANTVCSVHLLQGAGTPGANNKIISNINIESNNVTYYNTSIVMPANSKIYFDQAGTTVTFTLSGVEYTP